jgi:hypothetical protein
MFFRGLKKSAGRIFKTAEHKKTSGKDRSPHWPAYRKKILAVYKTCAACGCETNLEVHHIFSFAQEHLVSDLRKSGIRKEVESYKDTDMVPGELTELCDENMIVLCQMRAISKIKNLFMSKSKKKSDHHLTIGHNLNGHCSWKNNNPNVVQDAKRNLLSVKSR